MRNMLEEMLYTIHKQGHIYDKHLIQRIRSVRLIFVSSMGQVV
jgi:hypothetical protein